MTSYKGIPLLLQLKSAIEYSETKGYIMTVSPFAGKLPNPSMLVDVPRLITAYYSKTPDVTHPEERVVFGTSGHRGSSLSNSFNENHILAVAQAVCDFRKSQSINGPLFLGFDTHALSWPAWTTALEVLIGNQVNVMLAENDEFTPTPAISHAILTYNRSKSVGLSDGIVITPSHNPPSEGGFKYNPPTGGPADQTTTSWIEKKANQYLQEGLKGVMRIPYEKAIQSSLVKRYSYIDTYVEDLENVIDMKLISASGLSLGVDPLGGAGVHYWRAIQDRYHLNLTIVNELVDPTFRFVSVDWDGLIRMDPSSSYAMQSLIHLKDRFDVAFALDTDHDRHGIVTKSLGLLPANHYLCSALFYLFNHRSMWQGKAAVGKTLVSSQMIDRITAGLGRALFEVPAGFKWFVDGLFDGSLGFVGEESAGASFLRKDGTVWTTDKDGIILALLAGEMTAQMGQDPGMIYQGLTGKYGNPQYRRIDAKATSKQKELLKKITSEQVSIQELAGEKVKAVLTEAPGNHAPIGGVKVVAENGWFAARPSGTEEIYKIYAESFIGADHLTKIIEEAQITVDKAIC